MAAPVASVTPPGPLTVAPGSRTQFDVIATPDSRSGSASFPLSNDRGESSTVNVTVTVPGTINYLPATTTIPGATITQDAQIPSRYYLQV